MGLSLTGRKENLVTSGNPKRDRIENFESVNEAYVVEDYRCAALVENIQIGDFSAAAAETGA